MYRSQDLSEDEQIQEKEQSLFYRVLGKFFRFLARVSRMWLSHLILIVLIVAYTLLGALMFYEIEEPEDTRQRKKDLENVNEMIGIMWNQSMSEKSDEVMWIFEFRDKVVKLQDSLCKDKFMESLTAQKPISQWTYVKAIYFCFLVYTTIGYGDIVPIAYSGRILTIVYALIGIPFYLVVLADVGNRLRLLLKLAVYKLIRFYYGGQDSVLNKPPTHKSLARAPCRIANSFSRVAGFMTISHGSRPLTKEQSHQEILKRQLKSEAVRLEDYRVPLTVAFFIIVIYILLGALLFSLVEQWTYFESIYFIIITLSTVGFGEFTIEVMHELVYIAYVSLGMAILVMFITVFVRNVDAISARLKMLFLLSRDHFLRRFYRRLTKRSEREKSARKTTKQAEKKDNFPPLAKALSWSSPTRRAKS